MERVDQEAEPISVARAQRTLHDLLALAPDRPESHFHLGAADEILGDAAEELPESDGDGIRWRYLGALDAAARRGEKDRVAELLEDETFEDCLGNPAGRVALRAVGRMLLRETIAASQGDGRNAMGGNRGGYEYTARVEVQPFGAFKNGGKKATAGEVFYWVAEVEGYGGKMNEFAGMITISN